MSIEQRRLPEGWRWVTLNDVCEFLDYLRKPISEIERAKRIDGKRQDELYPYYGANGQAGWIDDYIFDEPLILLAEDGGAFGSVDLPIAYKVQGKTWVNNHAHVLRPKSGVDFDYCLMSLSIRPDVGKLVTGNTRPKLNQAVASKIPIPLPPLPEQQRIAAILREQMAAVEKARKAGQERRDAVECLFNAFMRTVLPDNEHDIPDGWQRLPLGKVFRLRSGEFLPESAMSREGIYPVYGGNGITGQHNVYMFEEAKLIIGRVGALCGCVHMTNPRSWITDNALYVSDKLANFDDMFMYYYLNRLDLRRFANQMGQPVISGKAIYEQVIGLPSLKEQQQIAKMLSDKWDSIERVELVADDDLKAISTLPAALMRRAFNGEL
jgi:type I restriction enzyme, S subunit